MSIDQATELRAQVDAAQADADDTVPRWRHDAMVACAERGWARVGQLEYDAERRNDAAFVLLRNLLDEMWDKYDGLPDSPTLWMGEYLDAMRKVLSVADPASLTVAADNITKGGI